MDILFVVKSSLAALGRLLSEGRRSDQRGRLVKASSTTLTIKAAAAALSFAVGLVLARSLGAGGYGAYSFAMSWVVLLRVPALFGLDKLLVRNVAAYCARGQWGLLRGLLRWADSVALASSIILGFLVITVMSMVTEGAPGEMVSALHLSLLLIPLTVLVTVRGAVLRGFNRVVLGQLPEELVKPCAFLVLVSIGSVVAAEEITVTVTLWFQIVANGAALLVAASFLRREIPAGVTEATRMFDLRSWLRAGGPLMLVGALQVASVQVPVILLGALADAEAVGLYAVAQRGAALINFILVAVSVPLAPMLASLHATGEVVKLQRVITASTRVAVLAALPFAIFLLLYGRWFLALFGPDFAGGAAMALTVLSVAELANVTMGSAGLVLMMIGHERDAAVGYAYGVGLNSVLGILLIPQAGVDGAAVAYAISLVVCKLSMVLRARQRLGLNATAFGSWAG
ncbi:MAG: oligosaccharide flippase family protein [Pyrinomonadaceae bacterium]